MNRLLKGFGAEVSEIITSRIPKCPRCKRQLGDGDRIKIYPSGLFLCHGCASHLKTELMDGGGISDIMNIKEKDRYWVRKAQEI
jgi:hypothetical protein